MLDSSCEYVRNSPCVCVHVGAYTSIAFRRLGYVGTDSPSLLFSLLCPRVFADQLNSTGIPQLRSLNLVPEEETESQESDDYY